MLYSEKVMDHFTNPRNVGEMPDASCMGEVGNAKCGDIMRIYLKINDDGVITDSRNLYFRLRLCYCLQLHGNRNGQRPHYR